jgi:predicted outer membrane protein
MKRALALIAVIVVAALLWPSWAAAAPVARDEGPVAPNINGVLPPGWKNTPWGPFGPGDQALLDGVRRADLWEGEGAAVMGMQKGSSARVRDVGKALHEQHAVLEAKLQKIAAQLQVTLPTQPNADQQSWLGEMSAANGLGFDQVWVDRLRAAHGKIFSTIASVRANTRNSLIRDYSVDCNNAVATHMALLESTGLVAYNQLPTPAAPAANGGLFSQTGAGVPPFVWIVLVIGVAGCIAAAIRLVRVR